MARRLAAALVAALPMAAPVPAQPHADWLDTSVDPLADFYHYANGGFLKANPVPQAYSAWGQFRILNEDNQSWVHGLLERLAADKSLAAGSEARKLADFYASGMDEAAIEAAGLGPLAGELARIGALRRPAQLPALLARLQAMGVDAAFGLGQMQDFDDSTRVIGVLDQGGLGLPNRDYYLKDDARFASIREFYAGHVARTLRLLGVAGDDAPVRATAVMALETRLAGASMSAESRRDPHATYHMTRVAALATAAPALDWPAYLRATGAPRMAQLNVAAPGFFAALSHELQATPMVTWRDYLAWQLGHAYASTLGKAFVDENFRYAQQVAGTKELLPRWRRVQGAVGGGMGFAIGREFARERFPPAARAQVLELVHGVRAALADDIATLPWMTPATRERAQRKLALVEERIGYPDKWRDYSRLRIDRSSYAGNVIAAARFEDARQLAKIGKPVDRSDWSMAPQAVNAYYSRALNSINFPAGILQPPFFDATRPAAYNYGAIGAVIGHEITHGFDDKGSQFDGQGNLVDWWAPEDRQRFEAGVKCIVEQYSQYTVDGDLHIKGELVAGESIADLGGLLLALRAYHASKDFARAQPEGGYTPDQQFFLGFGWIWAQDTRPEQARAWATSDPHPPNEPRVNGTLANVPAFRVAFGGEGAQPGEARCSIW